MVTLLDATLLKQFSVIFSIIFVIVVVFGVLQFTKFMGKSPGMQFLLALIVGLFVIFVPALTDLISFIIPWMTFFFIFVVFLLIAYKLFGASDADILGVLKADSTIAWVIFIIFALIIVVGFSQVYGQRLLTGSSQSPTENEVYPYDVNGQPVEDFSSTSSDFQKNFRATMFHPRVLGTIFILVVAVLTVAILSRKAM